MIKLRKSFKIIRKLNITWSLTERVEEAEEQNLTVAYRIAWFSTQLLASLPLKHLSGPQARNYKTEASKSSRNFTSVGIFVQRFKGLSLLKSQNLF